MRTDKIQFYMDLAFHVGKQGTCPRASVGAVIVRDDRVVSLGYNGAPRHTPHCKDAGCWIQQRGERVSCIRAAHAEANAIVNAAYMGTTTKGGTMFTTHFPCIHCLKLIINSGIVEIFYTKPYDDPESVKLLELAVAAHIITINQVEVATI